MFDVCAEFIAFLFFTRISGAAASAPPDGHPDLEILRYFTREEFSHGQQVQPDYR